MRDQRGPVHIQERDGIILTEVNDGVAIGIFHSMGQHLVEIVEPKTAQYDLILRRIEIFDRCIAHCRSEDKRITRGAGEEEVRACLRVLVSDAVASQASDDMIVGKSLCDAVENDIVAI